MGRETKSIKTTTNRKTHRSIVRVMRQLDKDKKEVFEQELVKLEEEFENSLSDTWHLIEAIRYLKLELKKLEGK